MRFLPKLINKILPGNLVLLDVSRIPIKFDVEDWMKQIKETGIMFTEPNPSKPTKDDIRHLEWIHSRMVFIHKENPNYDYMLKFAEIIKRLKNDSI